MFSGKEFPSSSSFLAAYASMAGSIIMAQSIANQLSHLIPHHIRSYLLSTLRYFFKPQSPILTLVIDESTGIARNQVYDASETYLCTKVSPNTKRLKISKTPSEKNLTIKLEKGEKIVDNYEGVELQWRLVFAEAEKNDSHNPFQPRNVEKRWFELSFHRDHKETILGSYIPYILEKAKSIKEELANIMRDSDLRRLFLATGNRSILVIEDIDCSLDLPDRRQVSKDGDGRKQHDVQRKKLEGDELFDEGAKKVGIQEAKRQKVGNKRRVSVRINSGRKTNKKRCS
ncbi:hypothetical protein D5086_010627 [Populus alba]|uniref:Uncharacterized protein n=1 Tax=Populus alba TaxID=43335 RepID=A0ACC4CCJ1_POPAL